MTETSASSFPHPETGESLETLHDFVEALDEVAERMSPLWRVRHALQHELAERFPVPQWPEPRYRTLTQEKVARCPRCGGRLDADGD